MICTLVSLCAATAVMAAPAPAKTTQKLELYAIEQHVIARTNAERIKSGLEPLLIDQQLIESARKHAAWMTNNQTLQHTGAAVAENIAMGQNSASEVLKSWMGSSGHRANILGSYTRIGVAAYKSPNGTIYWCQQFLK